MAERIRISIITPGAEKFGGEAELVVAPGAAGDLGALAHHAPLLTTLRPGVVRVVSGPAAPDSSTAQRREFAVPGGFMEVLPDKVVILTDEALSRDDIGDEDARARLQRAQEALAQKKGGEDALERRQLAFAEALVEVTRRPV